MAGQSRMRTGTGREKGRELALAMLHGSSYQHICIIKEANGAGARGHFAVGKSPFLQEHARRYGCTRMFVSYHEDAVCRIFMFLGKRVRKMGGREGEKVGG